MSACQICMHMFLICSFVIFMRRTVISPRLPMIETGSLFDPAPIPGIAYRADYIDAIEEARLIEAIDRQPWSNELLRRQQWYGWAYGDSPLDDSAYQPQPMPEWLKPLAERLWRDGYLGGMADRVLINEYFPGQGIGAHKDRDSMRIKAVAIVSLGSGIVMDFARLGQATRCHYLQRRSLIVISGEARDQWTHGIVGRKTDRVGGLVMERSPRLSVTFRFVAGEGGR